jgi:hypothetical protein
LVERVSALLQPYVVAICAFAQPGL